MRRSSFISFWTALAAGLALVLSVVGTAFAAPAHRHARAHAHSTQSTKKTAAASSRRHSSSATRRIASSTRRPRTTYSPARSEVRTSYGYRSRSRNSRYQTAEFRQVRFNIPSPLRGSHESLVHQNEMAEAEGLERILDETDLENRIASGSLVPVPVSAALSVNTDLPENHRYCRPWTAQFLHDFSQAHAAKFPGHSLEVTSAVRTVEYQRQLRRINGNAAAADGDIASPHLTGGTIDIGKSGLSAREIGWIRAWLIPLEQQGKIDVEEEFRQACFHISVYKSYVDPTSPSHAPRVSPIESATILDPGAR
ncbi:DUF5715 family protein [Acidicapsa dinghuensis]|uniref:DUF5715 family protein n=1 Tax=Acidicapsa dinghuensis TaxID=2218256 RepID=A0ABW1EH11_9BACT|nr:DUF5715 family protein [Acidicapsa dinghuensis]